MTYKTGFGFDDRICWTFIQFVTTFRRSLSSTGHSRLLTTLLLKLNCQLLLASCYSLGTDSTCNIVAYCCTHYLATGCLPRIYLRGTTFIEPLTSNGFIPHNIIFPGRRGSAVGIATGYGLDAQVRRRGKIVLLSSSS
jgi:hypothetical protein